MRETVLVFSERYCVRLALLSEKLIIPSESHMANRPFQPGFALLLSNPHHSLFCQCYSSLLVQSTQNVQNPLYSLCGQVSRASLPHTTKIPEDPTLEHCGYGEREVCYQLCCLEVNRPKETKWEQVFVAPLI